jgi:hypothetical protein
VDIDERFVSVPFSSVCDVDVFSPYSASEGAERHMTSSLGHGLACWSSLGFGIGLWMVSAGANKKSTSLYLH